MEDKSLVQINIDPWEEEAFMKKQAGGLIEYKRVSESLIPKLEILISEEVVSYKLDSYLNVIIDEELTLQKLKELRYKKLEDIFKLKWLQIQALAIDKPYMVDPITIQAQIDSYQKLYEGSLLILEKNPNDADALAVVAKYNEALEITTKVNLVMQKVRGLLEDKIENVSDVNDTRVDELLNMAYDIRLSKEDLTDEKLAEVLERFEE